MSDKDASERVQSFSGPLGDGAWAVILDDGFVDVGAYEPTGDVCTVRRQHAQHLRDFARNLERAAEHLELPDADRSR